MDLTTAEQLLSVDTKGVLVTLRRSGAPQVSNIVYTYADGVARISVTSSRAKTANLRRNPTCSLYVPGDSFWEFVVADAVAEVTEVSKTAGDDVGVELLEMYELISGEPPSDRDEYFEAMVSDERCILRLTLSHTYGQLSS